MPPLRARETLSVTKEAFDEPQAVLAPGMSTAVSNRRGGSAHVAVAHSLPDELVELIAERFRALAEPTRIKLLDRLREGEATVLELTALVGTTQQNVSKHLNLLQHAGVVTRRRQGNFAYYRIVDETVFALCDAVCGSLQDRFATLSRVSEGRLRGTVSG
jgi:DNA-binding transcriptional ArsR family regulator